MENFNKELFKFIIDGSTSYTAVKRIKEILLLNDYQELKENTKWILDKDKYFIIRNDASIIAFNLNKGINGFNIVATHTDTPSFVIKPNSEYMDNDYLKLNVAPYGGILNYGFMDTPFSIAGKIILKNNDQLATKIIDLKESIAIIPSVAIHQNSKANTNLNLNTALDLVPIISLDKDLKLTDLIKEKLNIKEEIYDYDLYLYNTDEPKIINNNFICSPRIDNLTCTYAALKGFINNFSDKINVLVCFNSEEIGSNTYEGADSNFLIDTLRRICSSINIDLDISLANSIIVSADNAHARHPNHKDIEDHTNIPLLNDGILIMRELTGTTNPYTSASFKKICEENNIPVSYYTSRNDLTTGSTLASLSLKHLSINSLDIGLPMLAMHSGRELIGIKDTYYLYKSFKAFYNVH
ncbi:MAG: M18 family aminopeptidase [Ruminococcus sp.]|nr:M18 family aminopeptidase [Ruminococcus sp.]